MVCPGLDPTPAFIDTHGGLRAGCLRWLDAVTDLVPAIKLQVAWFERLGEPGMAVLREVLGLARERGLLSIVDAKRGDVPHTMEAYLDAWLGERTPAGPGGDAMTVNAWLGEDVLDVCAKHVAQTAQQVYVLVHTSNPGASALLGQVSEHSGASWWETTALAVSSRGLGAVVGATHPEVVQRAAELMPNSPLLVPGLGAQGGDPATARQLLEARVPPLFVAARSILPPPNTPLDEFARHVSNRLSDMSKSLELARSG